MEPHCFPDEFGIAGYQAQALQYFLTRTSFAGKRVLEIGGSNMPDELVRGELGASEWVCIDIIGQGAYQLTQQSRHYERQGIIPLNQWNEVLGKKPYVILDGAIEDAISLPSDYFDLVISITSFEHVLAYPTALSVINRLKRKDALFLS